MRQILFFLCGFSLISVDFSLAEPKTGSVGRYADGRAYRVDSQGFQLSDQIAELEATIKEQETQISSCETQLAGKGGIAKAQTCPSIECPRVNSAAPMHPTSELCAPYTTPLVGEVAALREKLAQAPRQEQVRELSDESIQLRQNLSAKEENAKKNSQSYEAALRMGEDRLIEEQKLNKDLKSKLAQVSSELEHKGKREAELLASIDKLSAQAANNSDASKAQARAMLAPKAEKETSDIIINTNPNETKKTITAQLSEIQRLIMKRKDIFDSVRSSKKGITIQMQPLVTENGKSLDQLRQLANTETTDFGTLGVGLREIKAILISDIQVMDRLVKHL